MRVGEGKNPMLTNLSDNILNLNLSSDRGYKISEKLMDCSILLSKPMNAILPTICPNPILSAGQSGILKSWR